MKSWLLSAVALGAMGCASMSGEPPAEFSSIGFVGVSSPSVEVLTPRFVVTDHRVYLDGSVRRAFGAESTGNSRLQITFFNGMGAVLSVEIVSFFPAELPPRSSHRYNEGHYLVPIPNLPAGTSRIEVKAVSKRNL